MLTGLPFSKVLLYFKASLRALSQEISVKCSVPLLSPLIQDPVISILIVELTAVKDDDLLSGSHASEHKTTLLSRIHLVDLPVDLKVAILAILLLYLAPRGPAAMLTEWITINRSTLEDGEVPIRIQHSRVVCHQVLVAGDHDQELLQSLCIVAQ